VTIVSWNCWYLAKNVDIIFNRSSMVVSYWDVNWLLQSIFSKEYVNVDILDPMRVNNSTNCCWWVASTGKTASTVVCVCWSFDNKVFFLSE